MDELELLKKDWSTREQKHPRLSYNDIYNMLFKRSTSIVKWIFIISIAELLLWTGLTLLTPKSYFEMIQSIGAMEFIWLINILHYLVFIGFIYIFYKNYRTIKVTDSTKQLMDSIIKTRKTVKYFVIYNVVALAIMMLLTSILIYTKSDLFLNYIIEQNGPIKEPSSFLTSFFIILLIISLIMLGILILFYRIVYGILLRKLKKNHKELEKIEV